MKIHEAKDILKTCLIRAKRADRLNRSAARKLNKFSVWVRLLNPSRFESLSQKVKIYETERFNYMAMALSLTKMIRIYERKRVCTN